MLEDPIRRQTRKRRLRVALAVLAAGVLALWIQRELMPINRTIRALRSGDPAARLAAAEALGRSAPADVPMTIPALANALGDADGRVSVAAAESLRTVGDVAKEDPGARGSIPVAAEALSRAVADRRPEVRAAAAVSLGSVVGAASGDRSARGSARFAAETLSRALADRNAEVRAAAAEGLTGLAGGVPRGRALPWDVAAVVGRARLDGEVPPGEEFPFDAVPVADALAGAMCDPSVRVRTAAQRALAALASRTAIVPPARLLATLGPAGSTDVRDGALAVLPAFETRVGQAIPLVIAVLSDRDPGLRYRAASVLGGAGPAAQAAVPALIAALDEPLAPRPATPTRTPWGRPPVELPPDRWDPACEAARALGGIARGASPSVARRAVAALARTLRSEHFWRRNAAAEGLFLFGKGAAAAGPELASALAESVVTEGDGRESNSWAARALGQAAPGTASEAEAIAALTRALDSSHQGTRMWSVDSLARFGPPASSALPRLRALREDRDQLVAKWATSAVARIEGAAVHARPTDH